mmetsp:Transcript_2729/g.6172  ORF Transcript_2729/g.6172 Transcript_2729/m.6172 type:complete len:209 (-) Transcript_2729:223-849(-)
MGTPVLSGQDGGDGLQSAGQHTKPATQSQGRRHGCELRQQCPCTRSQRQRSLSSSSRRHHRQSPHGRDHVRCGPEPQSPGEGAAQHRNSRHCPTGAGLLGAFLRGGDHQDQHAQAGHSNLGGQVLPPEGGLGKNAQRSAAPRRQRVTVGHLGGVSSVPQVGRGGTQGHTLQQCGHVIESTSSGHGESRQPHRYRHHCSQQLHGLGVQP